MVGERIGGVNVFGGGLALYNAAGTRGRRRRERRHVVRGSQHRVAYAQHAELDHVPAGVSPDATRKDKSSTTSRRRPGRCRASAQRLGPSGVHEAATAIAASLPVTH